MRKCVFAGSFDPITIGHKDIVRKCLAIFDEVVVAILINPNKSALFSLSEREYLVKKALGEFENVKVVCHDGLLVDLLKIENTNFYVRGIRNATDYDYETVTSYINTDMYKDLITMYLPTSQPFLHISSTAVRDLIKFNEEVDAYVPEEIREDVRKYSQTKKLIK